MNGRRFQLHAAAGGLPLTQRGASLPFDLQAGSTQDHAILC